MQDKILIVDDRSFDILLTTKHIESYFPELRIFQANNGTTALELAKSIMPALMILDWQMPDITGIEITKKLKSDESTKDIFIIIATGNIDTDESIKTAFDAGANDFIRKPINKYELASRVKSGLAIKRAISAQNKINEQLQQKNLDLIESEKRFRTIVDLTTEGIVIHDDTNIIDVNKAIGQLSGFSTKELINSSLLRYIKKNHHRRALQKLLSADKTPFELELRKKDNTYFWAEVAIFPYIYNEKKVKVATIYDISERKKHFEEREKLIETIYRNETEQLKANFEQQKRELTSNAMFIIELTERTNNLIGDMEELSKIVNKSARNQLIEIIKKYRVNTTDNFWKEFELRFEQVHQNFYSKLLKDHTNLTQSEKKLCAFLRMNMSTKEIAAITHQSRKGIDVARSKLRQKLDLTRGTNICKYLEKY